MSAYGCEVVVYPEDGATRDLAIALTAAKCGSVFKQDKTITVRRPCGGKEYAVEAAIENCNLKNFPNRRIIILIDFDKCNTSLSRVKQKIPPEHAGKFYILGWSGKIEDLKSEVRCAGAGFNKLAAKLVDDCLPHCHGVWERDEFAQMRESAHGSKSECERLVDEILPLILNPFQVAKKQHLSL